MLNASSTLPFLAHGCISWLLQPHVDHWNSAKLNRATHLYVSPCTCAQDKQNNPTHKLLHSTTRVQKLHTVPLIKIKLTAND